MGTTNEPDSKLARELRSLQSAAERPLLDETLVAYLRTVRARHGKIDVIIGPGRQDRVSLEDIYVPVPVDVAMSVRVENGQVADVWLEDNSEAGRSVHDQDAEGWTHRTGSGRTTTFDAAARRGLEHLKSVVERVIERGS